MGRRFKVSPESISTDKPGSRSKTATKLVVILHGFGDADRALNSVAKAVKEGFDPTIHVTDKLPDDIDPGSPVTGDDVDVWAPLMPHRFVMAMHKPEEIISQLDAELTDVWDGGDYEELLIVGHSLGGLFARSLVVTGRSNDRQWATTEKRARIVMLAALNRGFRLNVYMGYVRSIKILLGLAYKWVTGLVANREPTVMCGYRGSEFLTRTRLDWIEEHNRSVTASAQRAKSKADEATGHPMPDVVQLLGSTDDLVGPEDGIDLATGNNFYYLDVPYTDHRSIVELQRDDEHERERKGLVLQAIYGSLALVEFRQVRPWGLERRLRTSNEIERVIFVIHGIRDIGHWTDKIARRVREEVHRTSRSASASVRGSDGRRRSSSKKIEIIDKVVDSYGRLGMGPFLFPSVRWRKVAWFMEKYLEYRARYPDALFSYVGHSHGTYILAKALETYPKCRFENVFFVGSVVRRNYPWNKLAGTSAPDNEDRREQVQKIYNIVATGDWVVALFPRFLDTYNLQDLGGAGHTGFDEGNCDSGAVKNFCFARGGHSAGKEEPFWRSISQFIVHGSTAKHHLPTDKDLVTEGSCDRTWPDWTLLNIVIWTAGLLYLAILVPLWILNAQVPSFPIDRETSLLENRSFSAFCIISLLAYSVIAYRVRGCKRDRKLLRASAFFAFFFTTLYVIDTTGCVMQLGGWRTCADPFRNSWIFSQMRLDQWSWTGVFHVAAYFIGLTWLLRRI